MGQTRRLFMNKYWNVKNFFIVGSVVTVVVVMLAIINKACKKAD